MELGGTVGVVTRLVECDDQAFARLIGDGGPFDYELGDRYIVAPAASFDHADAQITIAATLRAYFARVVGPTNLGVLGEPGRSWYVVPDVLVAPDDTLGGDALLDAVIAIEIRSPTEVPNNKLAAYREVMDRTGLTVSEVWYIHADQVTVHPNANTDPGETAHPAALHAVRTALGHKP